MKECHECGEKITGNLTRLYTGQVYHNECVPDEYT